MTEYNDEQTEAVRPQATPGQMLKAAREAQYRTQAEVAERLRLNTSVIQDIENDNYTYAKSMVYLRGYVRSYAQIINVAEEKILAAFDSMNIEVPESHQARLESARRIVPVYAQGTMRRLSVLRWVNLFVVLGLIALVAIWWESQSHSKQQGLGMPSSSAQPGPQSQEGVPVFQLTDPNPKAAPGTISSPSSASPATSAPSSSSKSDADTDSKVAELPPPGKSKRK